LAALFAKAMEAGSIQVNKERETLKNSASALSLIFMLISLFKWAACLKYLRKFHTLERLGLLSRRGRGLLLRLIQK
jgi:hypothetical protein